MTRDDELHVDVSLARELVQRQFPRWRDLPLVPASSVGTDNSLFRLGDRLVVRLPRGPHAAAQVEKEHRWLPVLAPHLPLDTPTPVALGKPDARFQWNWSVYSWLPGSNATLDHIDKPDQAARDLARFTRALRNLDTDGAPTPGRHNFFRGVPLAQRDQATRSAISALIGSIDTDLATAVWNAALRLPDWSGPPTWIHGDLQSGNLLANGGRLRAVIDFGGLAVADPACDMMPAWNLFTSDARQAFRAEVDVDEPTWLRGRAWALSFGLIALPYYHVTNPALAAIARFAIDQVLLEYVQDA